MDEKIVIKKLIVGGKGLGWRSDGMTVMAAGVLPGEVIGIRSGQMRKGYMEAEEVDILEPSPQRITPSCPYYQAGCGGCDLQHASYTAQLEYKREILVECLQRAGLSLDMVDVASILPSPQAFGYRYRLRLHLDRAGQLGFFQHNSRQLISIQRCLLATESINQTLRLLQESRWAKRWSGQISQVELLQSPTNGQVFVLPLPKANASVTASQQVLADLQKIAGSSFHSLPVRRNQPGRHQHAQEQSLLRQDFCYNKQAYQLCWDANCFFQVNALQSPHLVASALDLLTSKGNPSSVLDLFCGMGTFSVPLGLAGMAVTGLEHNRQSLFFAAENCRKAEVGQASFYPGDVGASLHRLVDQGEKFAALLFDPPRQGLGKPVEVLAKLDLQRIVSVSCDPATLARDLRALTQQGFYLRAVYGIDMFPQTHHIESLSLLERH